MSITGQVGHVALARQTAQGTPNVTAGSYAGLKITGDSLVASNNPLTAEGEIGVGRDVSDSIPGGFSSAGAINGNLRARAASVLLEGALGAKVLGGGIDTFAPANDLSWWSIEKRIGSASPEQLVIRYSDAMINTLNISAPAGALATYSAGFITTNESTQGSPVATIAYPASSDDLLVFHGGRIKVADSGTATNTVARDETFQSIEIAVNNNIAADEFTVRPSRFLRSLTEGIRSIEANMTLVFDTPDKYTKYTYGATANTSPGYSFYHGALEVFLGNFQLMVDTLDITNATPGTNVFSASATPAAPTTGSQALQINVPNLAFTGFPVALQTGRIAVTTSARALLSSSASLPASIASATNSAIMYAYVRPGGAGLAY